MQTSYLALFPLLNTKQHIQNHSCCEVCECAVNILQITVRNRRGSTAMLTVVSGHITAYIDHVRDWACPHMSVEGDPGPDLRHGFLGVHTPNGTSVGSAVLHGSLFHPADTDHATLVTVGCILH